MKHVKLFYFSELLFKSNFLPESLPRLILYACIAGPMAGVTSTIITNPLDVLRIRIQVSLMKDSNIIINLFLVQTGYFYSKTDYQRKRGIFSSSVLKIKNDIG